MPRDPSDSAYSRILKRVFERGFEPGASYVEFNREDLRTACEDLGIAVPRNLGDIVYSGRYRSGLPEAIRSTADAGRQWVILGVGHARYRFSLVRLPNLDPRLDLVTVKVPDATPEIVNAHAMTDEQALLAKLRYNCLVDLFFGITAYSLQSHLRTSVDGIGQIEIDEVYVGIDRHGRQFVVPVQAKGGRDRHSIVQTYQDIAWCHARFPRLIARPLSAQFAQDGRIVLFELVRQEDEIRVVEERHYRLVPAGEITDDDLDHYRI